MSKVSVSILSNTIKPQVIVDKVNNTNADYIHLDIMDNKFVNNKTWSFNEIQKILKNNTKKLETHLMVNNPLKYLEDYATLNLEYFIFHYESVKNINEVIENVKKYGLKVGISIKPNTNVNVIFPYLKEIDEVLIMSVEPGASGQSFIYDSLDKIKLLKEEIDKQNLKTIISVDGGINNETGKLCRQAGADMLVSASYIHKNVHDNVLELKKL